MLAMGIFKPHFVGTRGSKGGGGIDGGIGGGGCKGGSSGGVRGAGRNGYGDDLGGGTAGGGAIEHSAHPAHDCAHVHLFDQDEL